MLIRHLSSPRSVIVDVLRAIISRPISTDIPSRCFSNRHRLLTTFKYSNETTTFRYRSKLYTTQAIPCLEDNLDTKNDDASIGLIDGKQDPSRKSRGKKTFIPIKRKLKDGKEIVVNGHMMKRKKDKPKTVEEYNKRIVYAIMEDRVNKAIFYLREMESQRIMPTVQTYAMIINGYCKQSDMIRARKWLDRMLRNRVAPDSYIYTSLIDGFMRCADISKAEDMFRLMLKRRIKPSLVTYNVLMYNSVKQLDMASALKFWGNLLEAGLKADVYTFAIILHGLGQESRIDEAWRVFELMQNQQVDVNEVVATTLMGMHVKQNDNEYAVKLFNEFFNLQSPHKLKPTNHTRNVLLNAIISSTSIETIKSYYNEYKESLLNPIPTESPYFLGANVFTYTSFMRAFLRHNDLSMVAQVYSDMKARHIQPTLVTYATLMLAHAFIPDPMSCQGILEELKKGGVELNVVLYTIVMRAWAKAGNWEMVKKTYNQMKEDKIEPSKFTMEVLRWGRHANDGI
ncbi:hypothetical protein G6F46_008848 [Rhizopus delemar]|nr:hypothetical protein G6F55_007779 [Rhizopus delemar]KAG1540468.1 hypothetical protein G6F51_008504 [Rhizopus arrhizus]KAG1493750.1 hypothetical protein G6F54_008359 [Rhizopus delemar]KAG1511249.1 hypothetical protein G6F53_006085 [Rhizopus delemar]KAG1524839.1 hypothetical protein G6F52_003857 [Rhizopus delemar]